MDTWLIIVLVVLAVLVLFFLYGYFKLKTVSIQASSENIIILNDKNFQSSLRNGVFIVDFWAEWCGPCRMVGPIVEELAKEFDGQVVVGKMDVDENVETPNEYGIRNIPTILFFKDGQVVDKQIGATQKAVLAAKIQALL